MIRRLTSLLALAAVVVGCAGAGTTVAAVAASDWRPVPETGTPGRLVLHTGPEPRTLPDTAGVTETAWQVRTEVRAPGPVTLDLEVRKDGALAEAPTGLLVTVSSCDRAWRDASGTPSCTGDAIDLVRATPAEDWATTSPVVRVPDPDGDGTAYLLVRSSLADAADPGLAGLSGRLGLGVTARGDDPVVTGRPGAPAPALAYTGGPLVGPALVALAAVLAGIALRSRRGARAAEVRP
ncbi:hypothetical protein [Curtobacterium pusillum]|uniref:hypothetical protein n=1 Tax=Curtobacterium pusillum TaxID=69373 RepID=UPI00119E8E0C|nr:hypothetical protein [Curtobacterium pusillum]